MISSDLKENILKQIKDDEDFANELASALMPYLIDRLSLDVDTAGVSSEAMGFSEVKAVTSVSIERNVQVDESVLNEKVFHGSALVAYMLKGKWSKLTAEQRGDTKRSDFIKLGENCIQSILRTHLGQFPLAFSRQTKICEATPVTLRSIFERHLNKEPVAIFALKTSLEELSSDYLAVGGRV